MKKTLKQALVPLAVSFGLTSCNAPRQADDPNYLNAAQLRQLMNDKSFFCYGFNSETKTCRSVGFTNIAMGDVWQTVNVTATNPGVFTTGKMVTPSPNYIKGNAVCVKSDPVELSQSVEFFQSINYSSDTSKDTLVLLPTERRDNIKRILSAAIGGKSNVEQCEKYYINPQVGSEIRTFRVETTIDGVFQEPTENNNMVIFSPGKNNFPNLSPRS